MKISVVIPVYNTEKFIARALDSILSQDYKDFEIICVDDGSKDESANLIKEKANEYPCIKYYYQENQGPGVARKNGFCKASGELIFFVDSDDYLLDNHAFSKIVKIYNSHNPDVIFFNLKVLKQKAEYVINTIKAKGKKEECNDIANLLNMHINVNLYSKIMKHDLLSENMFIDSNTFEDFYTSYLYLDKCKNYYYLDEVLYCCYRGVDNANHLTVLLDDIEKVKKNLKIVNLTYSNVESKIIKSCIADYCSRIIVEEINSRTKRLIKFKKIEEDEIIKEELKGIVKILNETKFEYIPNGKLKLLKKLIFKLFLITHK